MAELTPNRSYPYPTYTDFANFPTNMQNFANAVDADVEALSDAIVSALDRPACRAFSGGIGQSINSGVLTAAQFATEEFDNRNIFNPGVSQTNFTIPESGLWLASGRVSWADQATGGREIRITRTAPSTLTWGVGSGYPGTVAGDFFVASAFSILFFGQAADVINCQLLQNSGVAVNTTTRMFSITKITNDVP